MNEDEFEKLLRAMPLKEPLKMPPTLFAPREPKRRLVGMLRVAISFRIPVWQAAMGLVVAVVLYAGVSDFFSDRREKFTGAEVVQVREVRPLLEPSVTPPPETITPAEEGFWRLPDRYMQMVAAPQKQIRDNSNLERSEL